MKTKKEILNILDKHHTKMEQIYNNNKDTSVTKSDIALNIMIEIENILQEIGR